MKIKLKDLIEVVKDTCKKRWEEASDHEINEFDEMEVCHTLRIPKEGKMYSLIRYSRLDKKNILETIYADVRYGEIIDIPETVLNLFTDYACPWDELEKDIEDEEDFAPHLEWEIELTEIYQHEYVQKTTRKEWRIK